MPISRISNVKIKGICGALPNNKLSIQEIGNKYFKEKNIQKVSDIIGIKKLYHASADQTTSDLCYTAAEKLIAELGWKKESINGILFVSQTPDYIMPATACILQNKLGLTKDCIALDINLGCSGYIYGVWLASQFIHNLTCKRVILLVGDTLSKVISKKDKSLALIMGDGVSATALEYSDEQKIATFALNCDGSGANSLIIPAGGFRKPRNDQTKMMLEDEDGNIRSEEHFYMNGIDILGFTVREVPKIINKVMVNHGWTVKDVDKVLFHQANNYMLKLIAKKAKIPMDKIPFNIDQFGNTSGASIPLLICDQLKETLKNNSMNVIMTGFGIGLSWGAVAMNLSNVYCSEILYV